MLVSGRVDRHCNREPVDRHVYSELLRIDSLKICVAAAGRNMTRLRLFCFNCLNRIDCYAVTAILTLRISRVDLSTLLTFVLLQGRITWHRLRSRGAKGSHVPCLTTCVGLQRLTVDNQMTCLAAVLPASSTTSLTASATSCFTVSATWTERAT